MPADEPSERDRFGNTYIVELLMKQLMLLKQDMALQTASFKNHVRNSQILAASFLFIITLLINSHNFPIDRDNSIVWVISALLFTTMTFYFVHDILDSVFAVKALEEFISLMERRLNDVTGTKTFLWQSVVADRLWFKSVYLRGILHPILCMEIYEAILILGCGVVFPGYVYYQAWQCSKGEWNITAALFLAMLYSIVSVPVVVYVWIGANRRVRERVRALVAEKWNGH